MSKILFLLVLAMVVIGIGIQYDKKAEYGLVSGVAGYMINNECQRQLSKPLRIRGLGTIDLSGVSKQYCSCIAEQNKRKFSIEEVIKMVNPQNRQQNVSVLIASEAEKCSYGMQRY